MTKLILTYDEDQSFGGMGFRIEGTKINPEAYNMATDGLLIAHDILEHVNGLKAIGTIGDELEALGGVWYIRGALSDLSRNGRGSHYNAHENVASDVANMGRDIVAWGKKYYRKVPRVKIKNHDCAEDFQEIIEYARKNLRSELEGEDYTQEKFDTYLNDSLRFMIRGYNKARAKYKTMGGQYAVNNLFWRIAETVDNALKQAHFSGQQFYLYFSKKNITAYYEERYNHA